MKIYLKNCKKREMLDKKLKGFKFVICFFFFRCCCLILILFVSNRLSAIIHLEEAEKAKIEAEMLITY